MAGPVHLVSCPSTHGTGGLGQHLSQIGRDVSAQGAEPRFYCHTRMHDDPVFHVSGMWERRVFRLPPFRWNAAARVWLRHEWFDRQVASRLVPAESLTVFMGAGLHTIRAARRLGIPRIVLEMPNTHPRNVRARQLEAWRMHPVEKPWMGEAMCRKIERELALVDEVRGNSGLTLATAEARGVPASILARRRLPPDARFSTARRRDPGDGTRRAVFVGSLAVGKGVPLLVDAFREVRGDDLRLVLVGGWSSRGMRRFLERSMALDPRILIRPGDPLPHLETAAMAVHPAWEDGWGYAPAEAVAAGVPTWVSDQTGARELVEGGAAGGVLPHGDPRAWKDLLLRWAGEGA